MPTHKCSGCNSEGFELSRLGQDRCTHCDGTEGGNPPTDSEVFDLLVSDHLLGGTAFTMTKTINGRPQTFRLLPSTVRIEDANS